MDRVTFVGGRYFHHFYLMNFDNAVYVPLTEFVNSKSTVSEIIVLIASPTLAKRRDSALAEYSTYLPLLKNRLEGHKVIFISSSSVYGLSEDTEAFIEKAPLIATSTYSAEKIDFEKIITEVSSGSIIIRPSGFFGWLIENNNNSFLNDLRKSIEKEIRKTYEIKFEGNQIRDFAFVPDLIRFIHWSIGNIINSHSVYNFGTTDAITLKEIVHQVSNIHKHLEFNFQKTRKNHIHSHLNVEKLRSTDFRYEQYSIFDFLLC